MSTCSCVYVHVCVCVCVCVCNVFSHFVVYIKLCEDV